MRVLLAMTATAAILASSLANAVPLFARQTGFGCATCHYGGNFPELTKTGREFKLLGYTMGERQTIPLAGMLQISDTKVRDNSLNSATPNQAKDGQVVVQQVSLFTGGKITDNIGAFVQWTSGYGLNDNGDQYVRHGGIDNTDIRFADKTKINGKDLIYGVSLNNSPSVQDVFNTTPAWNVNPSASGFDSFPGYGPSTLIDGGLAQLVAGVSAYADYNDFLYAELGGYRTADGMFSVLRAGQNTSLNRYTLKGTNPYWRFALHGDDGPRSWEVGTYGLVADMYSDPTTADSPTDRYKDYAIDGQYQYAIGPHRWSAQGTWIHEEINWNSASVGAGNGHDNSSDNINSWRIRGSYMYHNKVGGSVGLFANTGSTDSQLYASPDGSPDTRGYILEADYLPIQKVKLALQYTGFTKANLAAVNPDGSSRSASSNNTWYLLGWIMF
jgi:hypothetical protein